MTTITSKPFSDILTEQFCSINRRPSINIKKGIVVSKIYHPRDGKLVAVVFRGSLSKSPSDVKWGKHRFIPKTRGLTNGRIYKFKIKEYPISRNEIIDAKLLGVAKYMKEAERKRKNTYS